MENTNEPDEIIEARELLKEFENSPGLLKKSCFAEAIRILNDFLAEHPDSTLSQRVNNLKNTYTKSLIKRLGTETFSNSSDWVKTFAWVVTEFSDDEREQFETNPELKDHWHVFFVSNVPYLKNR
jgi:hypothetical protein